MTLEPTLTTLALAVLFATFPLRLALRRAKSWRLNVALLVMLLVQHGVMAVLWLWLVR